MSSKRRKHSAEEFVRHESPAAKALASKVAALEVENARLAKQLGLVESYRLGASTPPRWLRPRSPKALRGRATAVIQLSDLHLDEVVNPAEVNGLNAYNREIAEMRLKRWADKACDLGERFKHEWDGCLLLWIGDMVSGAIHEELRETNADVLPSAMMFWAPRLAAAIKQVADFYGRVHMPAVTGNHGRLTIKKQFKRRGRNSWDWLLSKMVASHFEKDQRFTFDIAEGSCLFPPIYDTHIGLTHGDEVGGGSGWSGIWSPLGTIRRRLSELAAVQGIRLSYVACGHWHQLTLAHHRGMACNGSLKGADEFSVGLRLGAEEAMQGWWAHTPEHGVTVAAPLLVTNRKAEGW